MKVFLLTEKDLNDLDDAVDSIVKSNAKDDTVRLSFLRDMVQSWVKDILARTRLNRNAF